MARAKRRGRRGKGRAQRRSRQNGGSVEFPQNSLSYPSSRWGSDVARYVQNADTHTILLHSAVSATTTGALLAIEIGDDPNNATYGSSLWSTFAGPFEEYRVLATRIHYEPTVFISANAWAPIYTVIDRDDATALTGTTTAARYSSVKLETTGRPWTRMMTMQTAGEAAFTPVTSPAATVWFKCYGSGQASNTVLGQILISWLVQFRGIGIS